MLIGVVRCYRFWAIRSSLAVSHSQNSPPAYEMQRTPSLSKCTDRRDGLQVFGDMVYTFVRCVI